jgi:hypothetical protein
MNIICIKNHYVLDLPFYLCFFSFHYEYLHGLAIVGKDVTGADLGDRSGLDPCNF